MCIYLSLKRNPTESIKYLIENDSIILQEPGLSSASPRWSSAASVCLCFFQDTHVTRSLARICSRRIEIKILMHPLRKGDGRVVVSKGHRPLPMGERMLTRALQEHKTNQPTDGRNMVTNSLSARWSALVDDACQRCYCSVLFVCAFIACVCVCLYVCIWWQIKI